jgi:hypothetical protein
MIIPKPCAKRSNIEGGGWKIWLFEGCIPQNANKMLEEQSIQYLCSISGNLFRSIILCCNGRFVDYKCNHMTNTSIWAQYLLLSTIKYSPQLPVLSFVTYFFITSFNPLLNPCSWSLFFVNTAQSLFSLSTLHFNVLISLSLLLNILLMNTLIFSLISWTTLLIISVLCNGAEFGLGGELLVKASRWRVSSFRESCSLVDAVITLSSCWMPEDALT